jgi:hypothetical protein
MSDYPSIRPSLNLNFARTKKLDPRITFRRSSTGTYVDSDGLIKTAGINVPRFDHNPTTGESLGLLVEEARTNVVTYSVIDATNWTTTDGATITANAAVAPDGTLTAALVTFPGANVPRINRSLTVGAGTVTQTVWLKAVTGTVSIRVGNPSDYGANQTIGTTWTRVSASYASGSNSFGIYCSSPVSAASFYAWGAQMELGSFPTSYIPTTASTVTRSLDLASMTGTNFSSWYNQSEGSLLTIAAFPASGTRGLAQIASNSPSSNVIGNIVVNNADPRLRVVSNSIQQAEIQSGGPYLSNSICKLVSRFSLNDFAVCFNGGSLTFDKSGSLPIVDRLGIGRDFVSGFLNGTISRIAYWPKRLPDAQLQALTRR